MVVQNLTEDDFTNKGGKLCCNVQGVCLVMFRGSTCKFSNQFFPTFNKLSTREPRISWATVLVDSNRRVILMAKGTKTPISSVPYFVLYVDGTPYSIYKGNRTGEDVLNYVLKSIDKIGLSDHSSAGVGYVSNTQTPAPMITQGAPIEQSPGLPNLPSGITKTPHNAPYLAYIK